MLLIVHLCRDGRTSAGMQVSAAISLRVVPFALDLKYTKIARKNPSAVLEVLLLRSNTILASKLQI